MADVAISGLPSDSSAPVTGLIPFTDPTDISEAPSGTSKKMTVATLFTNPHVTGTLAVVGNVTASTGVSIATGGLSVVAGGLAVSAGTTSVQALTAVSGAFSAALSAGSVQSTGSVLSGGATLTSNAGAIEAQATALQVIAKTDNTHRMALGHDGTKGKVGTLEATSFDFLVANTVVGVWSSTVLSTSGMLNSSGDFSVATNKFTVAASNGNTLVAGSLNVTGDVAVATNKFQVAAASGNTLVAGTLGVTGVITGSATIIAGATAAHAWTGRSAMQSPSDGTITLFNNAGTAFTALQLGGTSSSFPAIKRNANTLEFWVADLSTKCDVAGAGFTGTFATISGTVNANILVAATQVTTPASTTGAAGLSIPSGTAPTSPASGDMWFDGTNVKFRVGGTTKTFTLT